MNVAALRNHALEFLLAQYRDAMRYLAELRRAIASLGGDLPPDSPYRYVTMNATGSIVAYLKRIQAPRTIQQLIDELYAGGFFMGVTKGAEEIVSKSVHSNIRTGKLVWMNRQKSLVGLPQWSRSDAEDGKAESVSSKESPDKEITAALPAAHQPVDQRRRGKISKGPQGRSKKRGNR